MRAHRAVLLALILLITVGAPIASAQSTSTAGSGGTTAPTSPSCPPTAGTQYFNTNSGMSVGTIYTEVALLALSFSFDVIAIAYIISKIFPRTGISGWLNNEYWEVAKSAILIIVIYAAIVTVSNLSLSLYQAYQPSNGLVGSSGQYGSINSMIFESESYLCNVQAHIQGAWEQIGDMSVGTGIDSGLQLNLYFGLSLAPLVDSALPASISERFLPAAIEGVYLKPFQSLMLDSGNIVVAPFASLTKDFIVFALFPITYFFETIIVLLPSVVVVGLLLLVPMGLVFRAFPFVRPIGAVLLAMGITMSVIMPSLLILFNAPLSNAFVSAVPQYMPGAASSCAFNGAFNFVPYAGGLIDSVFCGVVSTFGTAFTNIGNITQWSYDAFFNIYPFLNTVIYYGLFVIFQLMILTLDLIILYSLADGIARAFGGKISLSLGGKLKLG